MKKLMFMLAAVACAATMQAAQLDWSLNKNSITTPTSATTYMTGQTSYLLVFATSAAADAYYASIKDGTVSLATAIASAVGSGVGSTNSKSKGAITGATATSDKLTEGASYYAALLTTSGTDKFILSGAVSGLAYNPTGTIETEGNAVTLAGGMGALCEQ